MLLISFSGRPGPSRVKYAELSFYLAHLADHFLNIIFYTLTVNQRQSARFIHLSIGTIATAMLLFIYFAKNEIVAK